MPFGLPHRFLKTITFDGAASNGAVGTVAIASVTGGVIIHRMTAFCSTLLAGDTATIELGTANNTAGLIAQTTATNIDAEEFWQDTTPETEISPVVTNQAVSANLILTVGTATITAGVIQFCIEWSPATTDGSLV